MNSIEKGQEKVIAGAWVLLVTWLVLKLIGINI